MSSEFAQEPTPFGGSEPVWTVTQLNNRVSRLLESTFDRIWLRGEISQLYAGRVRALVFLHQG